MILAGQQRDVEIEGIEETVKMKLSLGDGNESHIIKVLTENYKYPIESLIREQFSNHWDSHIEAGKENQPISVKLYQVGGNYIFETSDEGLGLSEQNFYKYYMGIGESTKRNSKNLIGGFGCGAKAALSYTDRYEVICRKYRIENRFLVFKGEETPECTKIATSSTDLPNGVTIKIPVKYYDYSDFRHAIREQLCYFPTAAIFVEGDNFNYLGTKIYENELFRWSEMYPSNQMHISFGNVHYEMDFKLLGISSINVPIAVKIPLDSGIVPFFNRESLTYNQFAKNYIKERIGLIADWFVDRYNSNWKVFDSYKEARDYINLHTKTVNIQDESFTINELLLHSKKNAKGIEISCIKLRDPKWYKENDQNFFNNYEVVGYKDYDTISKKGIKWARLSRELLEKNAKEKEVILVNKLPVGKFRAYLAEKYSEKDCIFVKKTCDRKLGSKNWQKVTNWNESYFNICKLANNPKNLWRDLITEWQSLENEWIKDFKDETAEFIPHEWIVEWKEARKRSYKSGNYKGLGKKEGDVTIAYFSQSSHFYGKVKSDKKAYNISTLHRTPYLTVYSTDKNDEEKLKGFSQIFSKQKVKFAIIGKREASKLPEIKNFKTLEQFMQQTTKPFVRVVTANQIDRLLATYDELENNELLEIKFPNIEKEVLDLRNYVTRNAIKLDDSELYDSIIEYAKCNNIFDKEIEPVFNKLKSIISDYQWITVLNTPNSWEKQEVDKYKKFINQFILFNKLYNNERFSEYTLVKKEETVV